MRVETRIRRDVARQIPPARGAAANRSGRAREHRPPTPAEGARMQHDVVDLIGGVFRDVIDGAEAARFDDYFTPDYVDHTPFGDAVGKDAFLGFIGGFR